MIPSLDEPQTNSPSVKGFLVIVRGEGPKSPDLGRRYEIPSHGLVIGNATEVDIFLQELLTHRCRIGIFPKHGMWQMEDLEPISGVRINGVVSQKARMSDGDLLQVGRVCFEFCSSTGPKMEFFQENEEARRVDILTQAYNRATILWFLEKELQLYAQWASERRTRQLPSPPMALLFLDIDHFGLFNKQYDQLVGDQVLRGVVDRIRSRVRATDIVGRIGGEELLVYLPNTNYSQAMELAEQIRTRIESPLFDISPQKQVQVTISIGVAKYEAGMTVDDFIRAANHYMKQAKESGRNRVVGFV